MQKLFIDAEFHEKLGNCEEQVQLPLQENQNQSHSDSQNFDDHNVCEESHSENENKLDSEDSTEDLEGGVKCLRYNLRNHSKVRIPSSLNEFALNAEELAQSIKTPETYDEALNCKEKEEWIKAKDSEINSLKANDTWGIARSCQKDQKHYLVNGCIELKLIQMGRLIDIKQDW